MQDQASEFTKQNEVLHWTEAYCIICNIRHFENFTNFTGHGRTEPLSKIRGGGKREGNEKTDTSIFSAAFTICIAFVIVYNKVNNSWIS